MKSQAVTSAIAPKTLFRKYPPDWPLSGSAIPPPNLCTSTPRILYHKAALGSLLHIAHSGCDRGRKFLLTTATGCRNLFWQLHHEQSILLPKGDVLSAYIE